jgi:hypothetical protein
VLFGRFALELADAGLYGVQYVVWKGEVGASRKERFELGGVLCVWFDRAEQKLPMRRSHAIQELWLMSREK